MNLRINVSLKILEDSIILLVLSLVSLTHSLNKHKSRIFYYHQHLQSSLMKPTLKIHIPNKKLKLQIIMPYRQASQKKKLILWSYQIPEFTSQSRLTKITFHNKKELSLFTSNSLFSWFSLYFTSTHK